MTYFLLVLVVLMALVIAVLVLKIFLLRKTAGEIKKSFEDKVRGDTNTLIDISCRDSAMAELAECINRELRTLRKERNRFIRGDLELKTAVTNISHDLRTPLTAIFGYIDLMRHEEISEEAEKYLMQIKNRADVMKQYTGELFRYSIIASEEKREGVDYDLRMILEESIVSFYGAMKEREIEPDVIIPEKPVIKKVDVQAVERIFGNIIGNALKYSDGDLNISMDEEGKIVFSNRAKNLDCVRTAQLFDRFYTVETGRNSTGIGLSIAKLLTERMGAKISAGYEGDRLEIIIDFTEMT